MATGNKATLQNMQSKLQATGYIDKAELGEPFSPPADWTAAIIIEDGTIDGTTLSNPREIHHVVIRVYHRFLLEPRDEQVFRLDQIRADLEQDFMGEFDFGGSVAYILPTEFTWKYGYQTIDQTVFRVLDITVGYRIDDRAAFAA